MGSSPTVRTTIPLDIDRSITDVQYLSVRLSPTLPDSPLLDYINFTQYRDIKMVGIHKDDGKLVYDAALYLIANMNVSSHEDYLVWVDNWKKVVAILSDYNHTLKRRKYPSTAYLEIYGATFRNISKERQNTWMVSGDGLSASELAVVPGREEMIGAIHALTEERIRDFLKHSGNALTALYNARQVGKLATSHIVAMNRVHNSGTSIGERLYRFFNRAA